MRSCDHTSRRVEAANPPVRRENRCSERLASIAGRLHEHVTKGNDAARRRRRFAGVARGSSHGPSQRGLVPSTTSIVQQQGSSVRFTQRVKDVVRTATAQAMSASLAGAAAEDKPNAGRWPRNPHEVCISSNRLSHNSARSLHCRFHQTNQGSWLLW